MTTFSPVWISTDDQLDRLRESFASASLRAKLLGTYRLREGTAHVRAVSMPWARGPLVFVSAGQATLVGSRFSFVAKRFRAFGWFVRNVRNDLTFEVDLGSATVEAADFHSPFARMFDIPFTRVRTSQPGLASDFLVCAGGKFSLPRIRSGSMALRSALMAAASDPGPGVVAEL